MLPQALELLREFSVVVFLPSRIFGWSFFGAFVYFQFPFTFTMPALQIRVVFSLFSVNSTSHSSHFLPFFHQGYMSQIGGFSLPGVLAHSGAGNRRVAPLLPRIIRMILLGVRMVSGMKPRAHVREFPVENLTCFHKFFLAI